VLSVLGWWRRAVFLLVLLRHRALVLNVGLLFHGALLRAHHQGSISLIVNCLILFELPSIWVLLEGFIDLLDVGVVLSLVRCLELLLILEEWLLLLL
jgi:hypothetical protein